MFALWSSRSLQIDIFSTARSWSFISFILRRARFWSFLISRLSTHRLRSKTSRIIHRWNILIVECACHSSLRLSWAMLLNRSSCLSSSNWHRLLREHRCDSLHISHAIRQFIIREICSLMSTSRRFQSFHFVAWIARASSLHDVQLRI